MSTGVDPFTSLQLLGVRVVRCPDLRHSSVYFHQYDLLVVDADLAGEDAEHVACNALGLVVQKLADTRPPVMPSSRELRKSVVDSQAARAAAYVDATCSECDQVRRGRPEPHPRRDDEAVPLRALRSQDDARHRQPHLKQQHEAARGLGSLGGFVVPNI